IALLVSFRDQVSCEYHVILFFFFFSSRRRHTSSKRDWSSDVCSSDLPPWTPSEAGLESSRPASVTVSRAGPATSAEVISGRKTRSEERRVGKECRDRWAWEQ